MIGTSLGRYKILERIGAGGMGVVYRARDEHLEREVAIKVLPAGTLADPQARRRFRKEALLLSQLNHPNIETIHDFETLDNVDFLVMEYIPGVSLDERLVSNGALTEKEAVQLGSQLAQGLSAAHKHGIVHRDLKPANLRVTPDGQLKILDFGVARLLETEGNPATAPSMASTATATGSGIAGTFPYMAPEQLRGEKLDVRTDVYAAGAVLYELVTAQRAHPEKDGPRLLHAILNVEPVPPRMVNPQVSSTLEAIIVKAMTKEAAGRHQSAAELRTDLESLLASPPAHTRAPDIISSRSRRRPRWGMLLALLAVIVVGLVVGMRSGMLRRWLSGPSRVEALAVLPLEDLSHDPAQEYFADGMTDQLINNLAQVKALRVISRTSIMNYKNARKPLPEIARELNVDVVVVGSILRLEGRVRISAQLVEARSDRNLWAQTYERDLQDALTLQSEVARTIVDEIEIQVTPKERDRLTHRRVDPRALDAYLRGRSNFDQHTLASIQEAIRNFDAAIAIEPQFALAHVGLSRAFWGLSSAYVSAAEAMPKARASALRALECDPEASEAYTSLGIVKSLYEWNWAEAERDFKRAIELKPSDAEAHMFYGMYLAVIRRFDAAIVELERARELDPLSLITQVVALFPLYEGRRFDAAIAAARSLLAAHPDAWNAQLVLGQAYLARGDHRDAIEVLQRASDLCAPENVYTLGYLGCAHAAAGDSAKTREILQQLLPRPGIELHAYPVALLYAALGDKDQAFQWLEKSIEQRSEEVIYAPSDAQMDGLRPDPRFAELMQRFQLPH